VVQNDPRSLAPLIEMGVVMQVNAEALLSRMGDAIQRTAEQLVRAEMVHVIASDGHNHVQRPPQLSAALQRVDELAGPGAAARMQATAARIIAGAPLQLPEPNPAEIQPKGRLRLPWRR
jgi:protein-tyrosine phosphatase